MAKTNSRPNAEVEIPEKLGFLFQPSRYKVAYGGRGGAKSWGFARALIIRSMQSPTLILCAREIQNSIQDSVHRLLSKQIDAMGFSGLFTIQQNSITNRFGSEFIFSGLRSNITKIKSMEAVNIAWVEEAEKVSNESWKTLIPTIRRDGSEIWVSFNPDDEKDPTYQRFVVNPPPDAVVVKINYSDNPWFPIELKREMEYLRSVDYDAYLNVWEGECARHSDAQVLKDKWAVEAFTVGAGWNGPYLGADWGFSTDPATLVECWIHDRTLYVAREFWGVGVEIDELPERFKKIETSKRYIVRADSSRPETISYMLRHGFPRIRPAAKWTGCVEDGISHLRSYERIVIHPSCPNTAQEARLYSYKTDRLSGEVTADIIDQHNHTIDAIRYALEPMIRRTQFGGLDLS